MDMQGMLNYLSPLFRKLREKGGVDEKELTRLWFECARIPIA